MDAAVSSSALACCSVRALRSWLPWAISEEAVDVLRVLPNHAHGVDQALLHSLQRCHKLAGFIRAGDPDGGAQVAARHMLSQLHRLGQWARDGANQQKGSHHGQHYRKGRDQQQRCACIGIGRLRLCAGCLRTIAIDFYQLVQRSHGCLKQLLGLTLHETPRLIVFVLARERKHVIIHLTVLLPLLHQQVVRLAFVVPMMSFS